MPVFNASFQQAPAGAASPNPAVPNPAALRQSGPIVPVQVEVPTALASQLTHTGQPVPAPVIGIALVDTGASLSAVDESVIQQLGVQPVGVVQVGTAGGPQQQTTYPGRFTFPGTNLPDIDFTQLLGAALTGQIAPGTGQPIIALLGRDLLEHFILIYNGPGANYSLAY